MQDPPNPSSERNMGRLPSRSPSPMSTAVASAVSPRPSRDNHPFFNSRAGSQDSQVSYSNQVHGRPREYKPVAAEDAPSSYVQRPKRKLELTTILTDCVVILLPVVLVGFVAFLWSLKNSPVSEDLYASWFNAIKAVATVLPIIFAAVVGRLMSEATRWRLEHGASLDSLEQLMGSRTVGGTITTLFQFQSWNLLTLALLVIWALSPLGTQSLLQLSSLRSEIYWNETNISYFDNSARSNLVAWASLDKGVEEKDDLEANLGAIARLYTTLVSTPKASKLSTMDLWGNVKIPYLAPSGGKDWHDVPQNLNTDDYSSLAGVPIAQITPGSNASLSLESSYIQLQCSKTSFTYAGDGSPQGDYLEPGMLDNATRQIATPSFGPTQPYQLPNGTWHGLPREGFNKSQNSKPATWSVGLNRFVDPLWFGGNFTNFTDIHEGTQGPRDDDLHRLNLFKNEEGIEAEPAGLVFNAICISNKVQSKYYFTGNCTVTQTYVESRVDCTRSKTSRQSCAVTAQRLSGQRNAPEAITPLSFPIIFRYLSEGMPRTTGGILSYKSEPSLYYIANKSMADETTRFLENVTETDLEIRLGQLLNTYYQLTQMSLGIIEGAAGELTLDPNITAPAKSYERVDLFGVSDIWAGICLVSCVVMLVAGVLSVVTTHAARGPEILGYVSTVLRNSRHMELAEGSDQLTAVELSKSLANERIRHGVLRNENGEELCIGVGREEDTGAITDKRAD